MQRLLETYSALTIGKSLRIIFVLQFVIAGFLILTDIGTRWRLGPTSDEPAIDTPVSPGDQVRRYEPAPRPRRQSDPGTRPDIELQDTSPARLDFSVRQHAELGDIVLLHGKIAGGDADRFGAFVDSLDTVPGGVALNSPGGIVDEALRLGRLVRERGLDTHILPGMACLSSCPYVLAGGVARQVSLTGAVGLHQHYYETPGYMPAFWAVEDIQRGQGETMRHLIDMGIDPGVMLHSLSTPPHDIYVLLESELVESRMATDVIE